MVMKDTPQSERPKAPLITHVLNLIFAMENFWLLMAWFVVNLFAALAISLYSYNVQYWGLGGAILLSLLLTLLLVTHLFRARKIRSIGNNSRRITKQLIRRNLLRRDNEAENSDNGDNDNDDDQMSNVGDDLEEEMHDEMKHEDFLALAQDVSFMEKENVNDNEPGAKGLFRRRSPRESSIAETLRLVPMKASTTPLGNITVNVVEFYVRSVSYGLKKKIVPYIITLLFSMLAISVTYVALFGICICDIPIEVTTTLSRTFMPRSCERGKICYTYLNLAEEPSTQMIVKFRTSAEPNGMPDYPVSYVSLGTTENTQETIVNCTVIDFGSHYVDGFLESHFVHTCDLTELSPNTTYYFASHVESAALSGNDTVHISSNTFKFRTLHESPTNSVRYVNGGDMGLSDIGFQILNVAIQQDPDFIAIGGDLVYGNAQTSCYRRWDHWLKYYSENAISPNTQAMIPILTILGNHEAVWGNFGVQPWQAKPYLAFFQHKVGLQRQGTDIFAHNDGAFHAHKLGGHTTLLALDSGIITPHGAQNSFITSTLAESTSPNKIAMYHAPLYPGSRPFDSVVSKEGRRQWEGLFHDGGIKIAFENHDHVFKRSKRLGRDGKEVPLSEPEGIYYLGDGAMGTQGTVHDERDYAEKLQFINHIWLIDCNDARIRASALDRDGKEFDYLTVW